MALEKDAARFRSRRAVPDVALRSVGTRLVCWHPLTSLRTPCIGHFVFVQCPVATARTESVAFLPPARALVSA